MWLLAWDSVMVPRHLLLQLWLNACSPMTPSGFSDKTLCQVMTERLTGTKPLLKSNYIHFVPKTVKPLILHLTCISIYERFLPIKQYQELSLKNSLANIIENIIFIRFICFRFMKFGLFAVELCRTDSQDEGTGYHIGVSHTKIRSFFMRHT